MEATRSFDTPTHVGEIKIGSSDFGAKPQPNGSGVDSEVLAAEQAAREAASMMKGKKKGTGRTIDLTKVLHRHKKEDVHSHFPRSGEIALSVRCNISYLHHF